MQWIEVKISEVLQPRLSVRTSCMPPTIYKINDVQRRFSTMHAPIESLPAASEDKSFR